MNNKGFAASLIFLISIAIMTLFFFVFFKWIFGFGLSQVEVTIEEKIQSIDNDLLMINYLRTPVDKDSNMADLLVLYYHNRDSQDRIIRETDTIFKSLYGEEVYWKLEIDNVKLENEGRGLKSVSFRESAQIPSYQNQILSVKLFVD